MMMDLGQAVAKVLQDTLLESGAAYAEGLTDQALALKVQQDLTAEDVRVSDMPQVLRAAYGLVLTATADEIGEALSLTV
jgi:hypothetical protein